MTLGGAEQTVVADFDEAWREDVLEEAADELLCLEGAVLELVRGRLFVRESELIIFQFAQAVVAHGNAKDVGGEILESSVVSTFNGRCAIQQLRGSLDRRGICPANPTTPRRNADELRR